MQDSTKINVIKHKYMYINIYQLLIHIYISFNKYLFAYEITGLVKSELDGVMNSKLPKFVLMFNCSHFGHVECPGSTLTLGEASAKIGHHIFKFTSKVGCHFLQNDPRKNWSGQLFESLGIQSPSENGNGTQIHCISKVIVHPNHPLTFGDWIPREFETHASSSQ